LLVDGHLPTFGYLSDLRECFGDHALTEIRRRDGMQMLIELVYVRWSALRGRYRRQPIEMMREAAVAAPSVAAHRK
jgi:hypothetical protein